MTGPVLVVGAGPVGLTLALTLRRLGVAVRVIDRAATPSDKSKALVLWSRTLELLDIQGCTEAFVTAGLHASGARLVAGGRTIARLEFTSAESPYNYGLMLPQNESERLLLAELERLGGTVERGVELLDFAEAGDAVTARLRRADGAVESVRASWLVGCDGAHSTVRHALDLPFQGTTEPSNWVLADVRIEGLQSDELIICWQPDGVAVFFPIASDRFRVIADLGSAETAAEPTLAEIQEIVDRRGPEGLTLKDPIWLSYFRINERKVADYRRGRVFLAGDAAHVHSPAGGQGMNTGMQDAMNLGWKLALVLRGVAGEGLLDSYSVERSAIGDQVLRNASTLTRVAILRNPLLQALRNAAAATLGQLAPLQRRMVNQLCELDLHYEDSPLTARGHGLRAADCALADGSHLYGALRDGCFALLSAGPALPAIPADLAPLLKPVKAAPGSPYDEDRFYLLRPDAYVSDSGDDPEALFAFLRAAVTEA